MGRNQTGKRLQRRGMRLLLVAALGAAVPQAAQCASTLYMASHAQPEVLGQQGNRDARAGRFALSADGSQAVFATAANNLAAGDSGKQSDIYLSDAQAGQLLRISRRPDGAEPNGDSSQASISGDGRWIAYVSHATDIVAVPALRGSVYLFDRLSGKTHLLTPITGPNDGSPEVDSFAPALSADGSVVAFVTSGQLLPADTDTLDDVYAWSSATGRLQLLNVDSAGARLWGTVDRTSVAVAANGGHVSFITRGSFFTSGGVFVRDLAAATTDRVANAPSVVLRSDTSLSADGRFISFATFQPLLEQDTNFEPDVYLLDRQNDTLELASVGNGGVIANNKSLAGVLSGDARRVCFWSLASNLVAGASGNGVYCRDRESGNTVLLSRPADAVTPAPDAQRNFEVPSLSQDGLRAGVASSAPDLVGDDSNRRADLFVFDTTTGSRVRRSLNSAQPRLAGGTGGTPVPPVQGSPRGYPLGDDGELMFPSPVDNLTAERQPGVFRYDIDSATASYAMRSELPAHSEPVNLFLDGVSTDGLYFLVRRSTYNPHFFYPGHDLWRYSSFGLQKQRIDEPALVGDGARTLDSVMSDDGAHVLFLSDVSLTPPQRTDIRLFLAGPTGALQRVDTTAAGGLPDRSLNGGIGLSRNGRYVAFTSDANNLVPGDTDSSLDLFLRDLTANTLTRLRHPQTGVPLVSDNTLHLSHMLVSNDGNVVVISDRAQSMAFSSNLYVLRRAQATLATVCPEDPLSHCSQPSLSADGSTLVFEASYPLLAEDTNDRYDIYRYDVATAFISLESRDTANRQGNGDSYAPQLSASGDTLVFRTTTTNWQTSPQISGDVDFVLKRRERDAIFADGFALTAGSQP